MTTPRFTPEELRQLHELAAQWTKIVSKRAFGDDGPGQDIVTATARFSSFRDATSAVQMAGIDISESQVQRLAHEVGRELIDERDRTVIEHRCRQLPSRVVVIPRRWRWRSMVDALAPAPPSVGRGVRRPEHGV